MSDGHAPPWALGPRPGSRSLAADSVCFPARDAHPRHRPFLPAPPTPMGLPGGPGCWAGPAFSSQSDGQKEPSPSSPAHPRGLVPQSHKARLQHKRDWATPPRPAGFAVPHGGEGVSEDRRQVHCPTSLALVSLPFLVSVGLGTSVSSGITLEPSALCRRHTPDLESLCPHEQP